MKNSFYVENKAKVIIISYKADESVLKILSYFDIPILKTSKANVDYRIDDHADLQVHPIEPGKIMVSKCTYDYYKEKLKDYDIEVIKASDDLSDAYPNDCRLNVFRYDNYYITKSGVIDRSLERKLSDLSLSPIYQNQAYANCMSISLENLVITCDMSIIRALKEKGIKVEYISNEEIQLHGHKTGFLGGSCGIIDSRKIFFTGNINKLKDGKKLIDILERNGYEYFYPDQEIIDLGGIIPIY